MAKAKKYKQSITFDIYGISLITLSIIMFLGILLNAGGSIGIFFNKILKSLFGLGSFLVPIILFILGIYFIISKKKMLIKSKIIGIMFFFVSIITKIHLSIAVDKIEYTFINYVKSSAELGIINNGGGILAAILTRVSLVLFGKYGTIIVLLTIGLIGIMLLINLSLSVCMKRLLFSISLVIKHIKNIIMRIFHHENRNEKIETNKISIVDESLATNNTLDNNTNNDINKESQTFNINLNNENFYYYYKIPPINILKKNFTIKENKDDRSLIKKAKLLESTLVNFNIKANVTQISCGPVITRYELYPSPGTKVSKIISLTNDIALSLAATDIRIEAPIPGKSAIGIEVPNKDITKVFLRDIIESDSFKNSQSLLTLALGKDIAGKPITADLTKMPHLLIAGATGSGKSVCINSLILSILYKAKPWEVKLILIDPKVVELKIFDHIPHLLTPVVTEPKKAATTLNWIVKEMEKRYYSFAEAGVKDIDSYNKKNSKNGDHLFKIVVIIDELADLMMISPNEVEDSICRIAQMARASGIHLIISTQRPSVDVITGVIKANIPSRISFSVSSQTDSRTILDMNGAEKLLGNGDMLFHPVGIPKPIRIQGGFVSEKEIESINNFVKSQGKPSYNENVFNGQKDTNNKNNLKDDLLYEALKIIIENGHASVSLIQRKLRIGYNRASRIFDELEKKNYIGKNVGKKPREVIITEEEFKKLIEKEEKDKNE